MCNLHKSCGLFDDKKVFKGLLPVPIYLMGKPGKCSDIVKQIDFVKKKYDKIIF